MDFHFSTLASYSFLDWLPFSLLQLWSTHESSPPKLIIAFLSCFTFLPSTWKYQIIFILQTILPAPSPIPQPPVLKSKHLLGRIFFPLHDSFSFSCLNLMLQGFELEHGPSISTVLVPSDEVKIAKSAVSFILPMKVSPQPVHLLKAPPCTLTVQLLLLCFSSFTFSCHF